jgi:hypothetical protein
MGCVLLSNWDFVCQNFSQEDNTPLSFYTKDFTLPLCHPTQNSIHFGRQTFTAR